MLLLSVLKYAGIVLLCLTSAVLFLAALVLFIPVRYRIRGNSEGTKVNGCVSATWLLHFLQADITCLSGSLTDKTVRILGIRIKEKTDQPPKENASRTNAPGKVRVSEPGGSDTERISESSPAEMFQNSEDCISAAKTDEGTGEWQSVSGIRKKEGFADRIRRVPALIRRKVSAFRAAFDKVSEKSERLKSLWWKNENLPLLKKTKKAAVCILKEILPVNGTVTVEFGLGDPWKTGRILEAAAWLFPVFEEKIILIPFFDERKLLSEADISGRIRLAVLLFSFLKVWTDRKIRKLVADTEEILNNESTI